MEYVKYRLPEPPRPSWVRRLLDRLLRRNRLSVLWGVNRVPEDVEGRVVGGGAD